MTFLDRLDPELRPLLDLLPPMDLSGDLAEARRLSTERRLAMNASLPEVPGVVQRDVTVPGEPGDPDLTVRLYEPETGHGGSALSYIHGGGMVFGSVEESDFLCRKTVEATDALVTSVEYRVAPEDPYPAAVHDCYAALRWLWEQADDLGVDRDRIAIGGHSAGGGLAAATALLAKERAEVTLCFQWLIYPMIDDRNTTPSSHEITEQRVWHRDANERGWAAYLGDLAGSDDVPITAAPARATVEDLRGLPPAYIDVGELDPFRDEDIAYAACLLAAGVTTELHVTPGAFHASEGMQPAAANSRRINRARIDALRRALAAPD